MTSQEATKYWNEVLTQATREEISTLYENKSLKIEDIINRYDLPFSKSKLPSLILPKQTGNKCKWCGEFLYIRRLRTMSRYTINPEYCICCGHVNAGNCTCPNCVEMRAQQVKQERAAAERRREDKRLKILSKYGKKTPLIDYDSLSLLDKVRIGIIFFHTGGKSVFTLEDYGDKLYPFDEINILLEMFQNTLLIIDDDVNPDAFSDDLERCNLLKIRFKININIDDEEIEQLMNGKLSLSSKDFQLLWMYMAQLQLTEYLVSKMNKYNLPFTPGKITETLINDMLEHFSISRSMSLIYSAITKACARYQAGGISRKHAANTAITIGKEYLRRAVDESWTVKEFGRDYDTAISSAEEYLYSFVLKIGESGFRCTPGMMSNKLYEEVYLTKSQDDTPPE